VILLFAACADALNDVKNKANILDGKNSVSQGIEKEENNEKVD
jgi:hypothetical protein